MGLNLASEIALLLTLTPISVLTIVLAFASVKVRPRGEPRSAASLGSGNEVGAKPGDDMATHFGSRFVN